MCNCFPFYNLQPNSSQRRMVYTVYVQSLGGIYMKEMKFNASAPLSNINQSWDEMDRGEPLISLHLKLKLFRFGASFFRRRLFYLNLCAFFQTDMFQQVQIKKTKKKIVKKKSEKFSKSKIFFECIFCSKCF